MDFNRILNQQVKAHFPAELLLNPGVQKFLAVISDTYNDFEKDKELTESIFGTDETRHSENISAFKNEIDIKNKSAEKLDELIEVASGKQDHIYADNIYPLVERIVEAEIEKSKLADSIFNTLISHLQNAVLLADDHGNILFVNQVFCEMFGLDESPEILLGKNIKQFDEKISALIKKEAGKDVPLYEGKEISFEVELNDSRFLTCNKFPFIFDGQSPGQLWTYTDITETVKTKEILNEQKKLTEEILNNLPADIALFDTNHNYLYVNPHSIRNEERRKAVIGKNDFDYFQSKGMDNSKAIQRRELFKQAVERKTTVEWLDEHRTANNEVKYMLRRLTPYFENNVLKYVFGYAIEVTDSKHYEKELLRKNLELEKLNSELDTFVYSASHNLRSPLTSIGALADLILSDRPEGAELEVYIDKIKNSVERLDSTIYDIIDYSKNSRLEVKPVLINIEEVINNAFTDIKFFNKDQIGFLLNCRINSPFYSDEKRIVSIVSNIISNAIKYYDEYKLHQFLKIDVHVDESACVMTFEDNGIGIPQDKHKKVFDMFYRNTNKAFGSGLGLFIVKEMVYKLNGEITLESSEGVGTKFTLTIPNRISFW